MRRATRAWNSLKIERNFESQLINSNYVVLGLTSINVTPELAAQLVQRLRIALDSSLQNYFSALEISQVLKVRAPGFVEHRQTASDAVVVEEVEDGLSVLALTHLRDKSQ